MVWPCVVALGILGGQDPWWRASHVHTRDRGLPCRIVKRSGANVDRLRPPNAFAVNSSAAVAAEPGRDIGARRRETTPSLRLALQNAKILCLNRHVQRKGPAARPLAIGPISTA